jgi:eukaryotic translation initiation factor 2C
VVVAAVGAEVVETGLEAAGMVAVGEIVRKVVTEAVEIEVDEAVVKQAGVVVNEVISTCLCVGARLQIQSSGMILLISVSRPADTRSRPSEPLAEPDEQVTKAEDHVVLAQKNANLKKSALGLACRPAHATKGQQIILRSNFFEISPRQNIVFYRYSISIEPLRDPKGNEKKLSKRSRRRLMQLLLDKQTFKDHAASVASDYASIIISVVKINLGQEDSKTAAITYFEKEETEARKPPLKYNVTVSGNGTIALDRLMAYLYNVEALPNYPQGENGKGDAIQALNIIMSKRAEETPNIVTFGQNKFYAIGDGESMADLGGALFAIRGYYCSVRTSTRRLLVNVNVCTSPFYQLGPLSELMRKYLSACMAEPSEALSQLSGFMKGVKVETKYLKNKKGTMQTKVKTVWGLACNPELGANANDHKFQVEELGKELSVAQFFLQSTFCPFP